MPSPAKYNTDELWRTFSLFTKVTEIDLAFMMVWREDHPPTSLFHAVTSISLAGVMSHDVLAAIFISVDASKLRYLRFNNLQTFAEPQEVLQNNSSDDIQLHRKDRAGPVQGWLGILTGKCTSLRTFHFLTHAEFVDKSLQPHFGINNGTNWHLTVAQGHRRYAELGAFVASVKPTLREFLFEHGPESNLFGRSVGRHANSGVAGNINAPFVGPGHDNPLPMDVFFDQHVLPVIASGHWSSLKKITIKGIGHWKPLDPWAEDATLEEVRYLHSKTRAFRDRAEMIWDAVEAGHRQVEFLVEDTASCPFYNLSNDGYYRSSTGF
ncbi:hypothetical protein B0J11DRAFT_163976 [Dendryphion nanum]|uniref:Uncharacterized protein n=1 Tax=Dendryphion nanum TaxID=256645 RepID=A0A9P9IU75_9PLEO|nr:hypothetical protein B0J11DRAFT_163976 [Dendryphion nanum]